MAEARSLAITGLGNPVADRFARRLLEGAPSLRVIGLGQRMPAGLRGRIELVAVDPGASGCGADLEAALRRHEVDRVLHLPFEVAPGETFPEGEGWLAPAAEQVAHASARAGVERLVVLSSTMLYGACTTNPAFLGEGQRLVGHPGSAWLRDQCRAEEIIARAALANAAPVVTVLRHPWLMGRGVRNAIALYFASQLVPIPLGYDPMLQFLHPRDLQDALESATFDAPRPGVFNRVPGDALPLSRLLALAGKQPLPMPRRGLLSVPGAPRLGRGDESPAVFYDFLCAGWVADGERTAETFSPPIYSTREAWAAFGAAHGRA